MNENIVYSGQPLPCQQIGPVVLTHQPACICGIDPGVSGGLAFLFPDCPDRVIAEDLPAVCGRIDGCNLARRLRALAPGIAIVEAVGAMPKQGIASTFKFGAALGSIRGVLEALEIPMHLVTPSTWKKYFRVGRDKEGSRALALRRFPACAEHFERKKDHNRAEAALLALYGYELRIGQ